MVLLKSLRPPTDGVRHEQAETTAVMDGQKLGCGTLYVAETRLLWFDGSGMGFSLEYPTIGLHAISRDVSAYPQEHLYVMVNGKLEDENEAEMAEKAADGEDDDDDSSSSSSGGGAGGDDDDEGVITEIRFVPSDKAALESMFSAMCECQALHPDPEDSDSDNDFEGEEYDVEEAEAEHGHADIPSFYTCDEGLSALTQEGQATLERLEGMLAQSVAQQYHMAGVRTEEPNAQFEDGMEVDGAAMEAGQFEDADVEHW
ncbi:methylosome subunit pICln-like isoform X1 [Micropterus salmoides]|uniref:methylosome subunit pICln-like isoform X1 n=2 Tax=Micropterus salmoides TaxID=27706 RepID=UPI0018EBDFE1|nr:methylosome subunit pICln-like isoform X1 [Micropterus salmoides]